MEFSDWLREIAAADWLVYIKRLSANDTGATKGHQVGVYFPKDVLAQIFPSINTTARKNPDAKFKALVDSDDVPEHELRAIYYNGKKLNDGTRNEKRITRWKSSVTYTPFQDPEKTGAVAVFAFRKTGSDDSDLMRSWVCRNLLEEDVLQELVGEVLPGAPIFLQGDALFGLQPYQGKASDDAYPEKWKVTFPTGKEIVDYIVESSRHQDLSPDKRIIKRRNYEYALFLQVEKDHTLPLIRNGFEDILTFMSLANSISNRRKSRSGRSLEMHLEKVFVEEGLTSFGTQCKTEGNKKPDFLFPDCSCYSAPNFPPHNLNMLAVKTTVKDRWRQILNEANKIENKFLFTLQEGVSINQFAEMCDEKVTLVVPKEIHSAYPESIRGSLVSLEDFITKMKKIYT